MKEITGQFKTEFLRHCFDDLNMAGATGIIFTLIRRAKTIQDESGLGSGDAHLLLETLADADRIAGFLQCGTACRIISKDLRKKIKNLVQQREEARTSRDWQLADAIRDELKEMGIEVIDTPAGPRWRAV